MYIYIYIIVFIYIYMLSDIYRVYNNATFRI